MKRLPLIPLLVALACASNQRLVDEQIAEYTATLEPLVGKATREDIARQFGLPIKKETIGESEFWNYRLSLGFIGGSSGGYSYSESSSWEQYDDLTFEFSPDGVMRTWKCYVQR